MNSEQAAIQDMMWDAISPEARQDWAVHQAAHDPKLLAIFEVFATVNIMEETKDRIKDRLEEMLTNIYGVPPERSPEVFGKAEAIVWQEMESDG